MISKHALIYPDVNMGRKVVVEEYVIIGVKPLEGNIQTEKTKIGDDALIRSHTIIYAGNIIGDQFRTGNKANIRENNKIGDNVSIGTMSIIEHDVTIGNNVRIHSNVFIPEFCVLEDNCWIGPNVVMTNAKYPKSKNIKRNLIGCHIKENAIIGANSTILPGVTIGQQAIIGAGSVVTKDIHDGVIVAGNPAKVINHISKIKYY